MSRPTFCPNCKNEITTLTHPCPNCGQTFGKPVPIYLNLPLIALTLGVVTVGSCSVLPVTDPSVYLGPLFLFFGAPVLVTLLIIQVGLLNHHIRRHRYFGTNLPPQDPETKSNYPRPSVQLVLPADKSVRAFLLLFVMALSGLCIVVSAPELRTLMTILGTVTIIVSVVALFWRKDAE